MLLGAPGKTGKVRKRLGFYETGSDGTVNYSFPKSWLRSKEGKPYVQAPNPPEFDEHKFNRCLGHISLNYIALKLGWEAALDERYDGLRAFVRYGNRGQKWPYGQISYNDMDFRKKLTIGLDENAPMQLILFESYIDDFYIAPLDDGDLEKYLSTKSDSFLYFK